MSEPSPAVAVDWALVTRVVDRIVPADDFPSAAQAGVAGRLAEGAGGANRALWAGLLGPGFAALAAELGAELGGRDLDGVTDEELDQLLERLSRGETGSGWAVGAEEFWAELVRVTAEQYYGSSGAAGWALVGYSPAVRRSGQAAAGEARPLVTHRVHELRAGYDAIVVGVGAGGGVAAAELAARGLTVLAADRGELLSYEQIGQDHLRNFRLSRYGHNAPPGAAAGARVWAGAGGHEQVVTDPWDSRWSALPQTIGGGTRVYQGMAWRLLPTDFALATRYGVPDGSSLADWPIGYDDLEPYYTEIEWSVGVSGDGAAHRNQGHRSRDYPMPPLPDNTEAQVLRAAAGRLGWTTGPIPMLINSEPRYGRGRCGQCGQCVGFACPTGAKNGPYNSVLPEAQATGDLTVATQARAVRIRTDGRGRVSGVALMDTVSGLVTEVAAGQVVIACSAIETPRLLLHSASDHHPGGLGNATGQVGRHLQGHRYVGAFGTFDDPVIDGAGPNARLATCEHLHRRPGVLGGVLANEILKLPIVHWNWALPPDAPRAGRAGKDAMRHLYRRTSHLYGPVQEIPRADNRVRLAPGIRDAQGIPVARLTGHHHPEDARSAELLIEKAAEWLTAAGARRTWSLPYPADLLAGQHQAGTCRMGDDPATSVTDRWGRVHGHDNLWIADGSVHVTNGGFNPVLTIMALALRSARHLAA
ncbi:MAG: GMC family oxidoreductase N-terminal domain-containing protein [Actinobacteria bacterium]|nr:GMC family oxidoreductase N-terminal domain-containing protein [Actinomycetota bacterium]